MKYNRRIFSFLIVSLFFIAGCRKDTMVADPISGSDLFVSATSSGSFTKTQIQAFAQSAGLSAYNAYIKYDVEYFKFIYKTTYKGSQIQASGLVGIPKNVPSAPSLLSAQHGTMFKFTDAPSNFPATFTGFELFASGGFVTIIPDLIGFGSSQNIPHPYYDQKYSGTAVVDMIKAVKYYLSKQNIAVSNRLFLFGYSEGGYVTMATQKEIETNVANNLTVTAAAEGAGGYDLTGMLSGIATTASYGTPSYLALLIKSYDSTYNWNRPYSDFFQAPYASRIPTLLNGTKTGSEIDAQLTNSPTALFTTTFYNNLLSPTGETVLKQQLTANSFLTWVPKSPTRLFHGTADEAVFYQTSVNTFNRFKAAGATNVEFFTVQNGTHESSIQPMIENVLPWIQSLDK
ncbi:MAG: prolyl oligopeptidase family serine peptidase [Bacteroidota bacterium]|nr:prolyl oligopeptidase family serine peptidase [Bacteroidota bacterium]